MTARSASIDPDPFSIIVVVTGVIGGLASALSVYREFVRDTPVKSYKNAVTALESAKDLIRYVELDIQVLREIIDNADIPIDRRFRLGRRAFLTKTQFKRYAKTTDQLFGRLRRILKATHLLDQTLPALSDIEMASASKHLANVQGRLDRLLQDRQQTIEQSFEDLLAAVMDVNLLISELLDQLQETHETRK